MTEKLVIIRNFAYGPDPVSEAELARLKLEAAGIPCFLAGKEFASTSWLYSGAASGVKLQVRQSDVERALALLGPERVAAEREQGGETAAGESESPACPRCHSDDVEHERFSRRFFYLSLLLLGFPLLWVTGGYRCRRCGHTWREVGRGGHGDRTDADGREPEENETGPS